MVSAMISKVLVVMVKHVTTFSSLFGVATEGGMLGMQCPCEVSAFYVPSVSSQCHQFFYSIVSLPTAIPTHDISRLFRVQHQILLPESGQTFGNQSQTPTWTRFCDSGVG
jgi:hypothetical protein